MVYLYIVAALYVLVEFLKLDKVLAYAVVYLLAYVMEYTITLLFVFRARFKYRMTVKYVIYVAGFLTVSTLTYKAMLLAGIDYLPCRDPDRISAVACPLCRQQILGLSIMSGTGIDRRIMHALLIATGVFILDGRAPGCFVRRNFVDQPYMGVRLARSAGLPQFCTGMPGSSPEFTRGSYPTGCRKRRAGRANSRSGWWSW